MDKVKLVEKFNEAIGLEFGAMLQYNQYAQVLMGQDRQVWQGFFLAASDEALGHARKFAERVVALGGVPNVEPDPVKQTNDITEMLRNSLRIERRALETYTKALTHCEDNPGYRNLLEDQIQAEMEDVEELEIFLEQVEKLPTARSGITASTA